MVDCIWQCIYWNTILVHCLFVMKFFSYGIPGRMCFLSPMFKVTTIVSIDCSSLTFFYQARLRLLRVA